MTRKVIFPVTRVHEPLRVDVEIEGGRVADAWVSGHLFRGWECMLAGRDVRDVVLFTQRICGICSTAHAVADSMALQQASGLSPTPNGQHLTNLILAADILQNHLRHFYLLTLFDFVAGPAIPPWLPRTTADLRLPKKVNDAIVGHLAEAVRISAMAHELLALFGGKAPHQQTVMVTGVTQEIDADKIKSAASLLREIRYFVEEVHIADALTIGEYYKEYYDIGVGSNYMSFGMFPDPQDGRRVFRPGVVLGDGPVAAGDWSRITEDVTSGWYRQGTGGPPTVEATVPDPGNAGGYSWIKAPRYDGLACESGPLARGWINGYYRRGRGTMDRIVARARETLRVCLLAEEWVLRLVPGAPSLRPFTLPPQGEGVGFTDVMRGALGHWLRYRDGRIEHHQIVTPTTWMFSPRDATGRRGPVEEALVGVAVADVDNPVEVGRVIRSFDPCLTCAVHVINKAAAGAYIV